MLGARSLSQCSSVKNYPTSTHLRESDLLIDYDYILKHVIYERRSTASQCDIVTCFDYPEDDEADRNLRYVSVFGLIVTGNSSYFSVWSDRFEAKRRRKFFGCVDYSNSFRWLFHLRGKKHFKLGKRQRLERRRLRRLELHQRILDLINSRREASVATPIEVLVITATITLSIAILKFRYHTRLRRSGYVTRGFCPSDSLLPPWSSWLPTPTCVQC